MCLDLLLGTHCPTSRHLTIFCSVFTHFTAACCVLGLFREGMSGVVASLLGIVQSPGVDNRFSVTAFFVCVALLMTCSAAAFAGISRRGAWKKELRDVHTVDGNSSTSSHSNHRAVGNGAGSAGSPTVDRRRSGPRGSTGSNNSSDGGSAPRDTVNESSPIVAGTPRSTHPEAVPELHLPAAAPQDATSQSEISLVSSEAWGVLKMCAGPLLALWWLSFMSNGVLLSFRTYITLPYKNGDNVRSPHTHDRPQLQSHIAWLAQTITQVLFWTGVLVTLADPFAALLTTWPKLRWQRLGWLSALWSILAGYVVVLAFTSPHPPLAAVRSSHTAHLPVHSLSQLVVVLSHVNQLAIGGPLVVLALVITRCLVSYTRSMSLLVLHQRSASNVASRHIASSWAGIMMQAGALIGSVAAFVVVSGTDWLQQHSSSR